MPRRVYQACLAFATIQCAAARRRLGARTCKRPTVDTGPAHLVSLRLNGLLPAFVRKPPSALPALVGAQLPGGVELTPACVVNAVKQTATQRRRNTGRIYAAPRTPAEEEAIWGVLDNVHVRLI